MDKELDYYDKSVIEKGENFVIIKKKIMLEEGKTTPKGEYPKLKEGNGCAFPERQSCNFGEFFIRCPYMKCKSIGVWECSFNK